MGRGRKLFIGAIKIVTQVATWKLSDFISDAVRIPGPFLSELETIIK
jgi:hypothetical protein